MAISIQGSGGSEASTVTIPAHAAGDLIVISAARANNTPASIPAAGGTVPTWTSILSGGANTWSQITCYTVATANNHTSGTWSLSSCTTVIVLRGDRALSVGASASANGTGTFDVVYPAATFNNTDGTSMGLRFGSRSLGDTEMETNIPSAAGWTFRNKTSATPKGAVLSKAGITSNPTSDTNTFTGSAVTYRCHTVEVKEAPPPTYTATAALTVGAATLGGRALQVDLLTNLAVYYKLDEASGNAIDAVAGLNLTDTNAVAATTGKVSGCRDFESGSTQYFTRADHATFSAGDIDFTVAAWVQLESKGTARTILAKYDTGGSSREYWLQFSSGADRFAFTVSSNGTSTTAVTADNLGSPALATWYHVVAWHDAANNVIGICVNAGTPNTAAHTTGVFDGTAPFMIGARAGAADLWDGLIDELGLWKSRVLTTAEREYLHNQGAGRPYSEFGGAVAGTYTGTAAVTVGHATLAATATFTKPTYTGTAALTPAHATLAASATFVKPTYSGTGALTAGKAALAASGTFTVPTYTGTASLTTGMQNFGMSGMTGLLSGYASFTAPTYEATATLAVSGAGAAASGTFTTPTYTAAAAVRAAAAGLDAAGTFATPHYSATADVAAGPAVFLAAATFAPGTHEATASVTVGGTLFAGAATFVETVPQGGVSLAASLVYAPTPAGEVYATDAALDVYTGRLAKGGVR